VTINTRAYCEAPGCHSHTTLLRDNTVIAPQWITANIADTSGEWYQGSPAHARHFCSHQCLAKFLDASVAPWSRTYDSLAEMNAEFRADESRLSEPF
jgi:hypothetical protein